MTADRGAPPPPADLRAFEFPRFADHRLANGLRVLHAQASTFPIVVVGVLIDSGAAVDPAGRAGTASLVAELLDAGSGRLDSDAVARRFETLGLRMRANAGWDELFVSLSGEVDAVEAGMDLFARLVRAPSFPEEEFDRLRSEELASIRQRRSDPRALGNEALRHLVYSDASPFRRSPHGTERSLDSLTLDDVREYHGEWVVPGRTTVIVVGDVTTERALQWTERCFGAWTGDPPTVPDISVAPRSEDATVVVVNRPGAVQSEIRVGQIGVGRRVPEFIPLRVMNALLGGAFSSRLNLNLRERHGFTYGASSSFTFRRHRGPFLISTAVQSEVTGAALVEVLREVRRIRETLPGEDELSDIRDYLAGTFPLRLQTIGGVAGRLADLALHDLDRDEFDRFQERVLAVTAEEVRDVAVRFLDPPRFTVAVVGDAARVVPQLQSLDHADVRVISPDELGVA